MSKSTVLAVDTDAYKSKTYSPFVKGKKLPIRFEQDLRGQLVTISVNNKMVKQWSQVKNPGDFQHPFFYNEDDLKLEIKWDEDAEEPLLFLDGVNHDELPYLEPTFRLEDNELPEYKMGLSVNNRKITEYFQGVEWEPHVLEHKITKTLLGDEVDEIFIEKPNIKSLVMTETLDLLSRLRMPSTGLKKFTIKEGAGNMDDPIQQSVIEQFATKCENLTELIFGSLNDHRFTNLGKGGLEGLAELAAQIIRTSTCLKGIYLYSNLFNKHSTAAIWTAAASSPSIEVIEEFVFSTSACMNEEDARVAMCEFLAAALALRKFDMRWQTG